MSGRMEKSKAAFSLVCLFIELVVSFGQGVSRRNVFHFNLDNNWVGPPAAILKTAPHRTTVIYEMPAFEVPTVDNKTVLKLGRATLQDDGITWEVENEFLDAAKLSLSDETSVTRGGVLKNPEGTAAEHYVVAYGTRDVSMQSNGKIHTCLADKNFAVSLGKKGYEGHGITPTLFNYKQAVYVAYLSLESNCHVQIAKAEANARIIGEIRGPDRSLNCRSPQLFQLDDDYFALVISFMGHLGSSRQSAYVIGQMKGDEDVTFSAISPWKRFDCGYGANYFTFSNMGREIIAIGWLGYDGYGDMGGLTLPRKISFDPKYNVLKQNINVEFMDENCWTPEVWSDEMKAGESVVKNLRPGPEAILLELNFKELTTVASVGFQQTEGSAEVLSIRMDSTSSPQGRRYLLLVHGKSIARDLGDIRSSAVPEVETEDIPRMNGTLKIVLDKSTVEVYGADGWLVITESFRLTDSAPFSLVTINVQNDMKLEGRITRPRRKKSDEKKSDEKKSDEKKSDEKKSDEKKNDERESDYKNKKTDNNVNSVSGVKFLSAATLQSKTTSLIQAITPQEISSLGSVSIFASMALGVASCATCS